MVKGETIHIGRWKRKWRGMKGTYEVGWRKDGRERKDDEGSLGKERCKK